MSKQCITKGIKNQILVMDGAMGTMLQEANLTAADFGGVAYEGCNDYLNLTAPDVVAHVHRTYLEAGADIISTNTFGATRVVLDEYDLGQYAYEVNKRGSEIAAAVVKEFSTDLLPRYVAGSMGPTTKMLSLTGGITFEALVTDFSEQALGMIDGGVDFFLVETAQDTLNVKAAYLGIKNAQEQRGVTLPLMISGTIEAGGTTLSGQNIEAFYFSLAHLSPFAIGLNCATGPSEMKEHIQTLSDIANCGVSCYPNAGLPDEHGCYNESPEELAMKIAVFAAHGWLNIVGGCCGTTPSHIAAIREAVVDKKPRTFSGGNGIHVVSGLEALHDHDANLRPILVGERTNVIGSRKFKRLIRERQFEVAAEIAMEQVAKGAHVIDVCVSDPESNELKNMAELMKELANRVKVPFMIDSLDSQVVEVALQRLQGKCIINSINLEEGEDRFPEITRLIKEYGAAIVVGTIDEKGMAVKAQDKLKIARRAYELLTVKYGILPEDIIFDPLVFPVGTGDVAYLGSARATIEGIRLIKEAFPLAQTILGLSNISFGLPPVGREILNAVFLHHCVKAGLDYAIVNTEKLERFAVISETEIKLADDLLFKTSDATLAVFADFYRDKKPIILQQDDHLTVEERLIQYVVTGTKNGLVETLALGLEKYENPLDLVNGPLMTGMMKVGELFNDNQLIVAEVLQSASVMKAAVSYLENFMESGAPAAVKGKFLIATVKGDVHDIGKNLVEIIMSNNGYEVIDLGIKVESQTIIDAVREHQPDIVGLSGLLVKSAEQMILTAGDMKAAGINLPIIVGGAALSRKFTEKIADAYDGIVLYAKDAMHGLELTNALMTSGVKAKRTIKSVVKKNANPTLQINSASAQSKVKVDKTSNVNRQLPVVSPKSTQRRTVEIKNKDLYPYIDTKRLYKHHLGVRNDDIERKAELTSIVHQILDQADGYNWLKPRGVYQFFPAQSKGNQMIVYDGEDKNKILEIFDFPRQNKEPYLCLADYVKSVESGEIDYVGFFIVTSGSEFIHQAEVLRKNGEYLESHILSSIALESAEAMAIYVHEQMRKDLNIKETCGNRFSFGYPACPDLAMQEKLFRLLAPTDIGVELTEGYMMVPIASVSAMVLAHPEARYFSV